MNVFRKAILAAACAGSLVTLAAPALAQTTLRVVMHSDLKILDPIWTTAYIVRNHGYMIYDMLLAQDEKGEIKPQMVEKYEAAADGKSYTFTLRDGLLWHDGQPVTSEDCIASIKRWAAKDFLGQKMMTFVDYDFRRRCQDFHHQAQGTDRSRAAGPVETFVERAVHDAQAGRRNRPQQADRGFHGIRALRLHEG